jgi:hypothetical protein
MIRECLCHQFPRPTFAALWETSGRTTTFGQGRELPPYVVFPRYREATSVASSPARWPKLLMPIAIDHQRVEEKYNDKAGGEDVCHNLATRW